MWKPYMCDRPKSHDTQWTPPVWLEKPSRLGLSPNRGLEAQDCGDCAFGDELLVLFILVVLVPE